MFTWNRDRVPNPNEMARTFHDAGIQTIANIKPAMLTTHPRYGEAAKLFIRKKDEDAPGAFDLLLELFCDSCRRSVHLLGWRRRSFRFHQSCDYQVVERKCEIAIARIWYVSQFTACADYQVSIVLGTTTMNGISEAMMRDVLVLETKFQLKPFDRSKRC